MKRIQHKSAAQQYSYIVRERTQLQVRRMGPFKYFWAKMKYHFCYTKQPEDIKFFAVLIGIILFPAFGSTLLAFAFVGLIKEIIRFQEFWYWITKFKMPDQTRYSLIGKGEKTEKVILPEDQAKIDRKQKRAERFQERKEKRLAKRTLAKH